AAWPVAVVHDHERDGNAQAQFQEHRCRLNNSMEINKRQQKKFLISEFKFIHFARTHFLVSPD
ncbi:hypothetical protein, partial [Ralstonia pseudosolanacearum]|uniref:hypothetical protein n=1 Tax=Ralstonia pseudosolanacearum TaxID=1310165 RepID=UPI001FF7EDF6